eukprot:Skav236037  [mRNA]  locus=scaffold1509:134139:136059:+ [translate_table: standard]
MASTNVWDSGSQMNSAVLQEHQLSLQSRSPVAESTSPAKHSNSFAICDDDSDDGCEAQPFWKGIQCLLLADDIDAELSDLVFSVDGVLVDLEILRPYSTKRHVPVSRAVANHITGGVLPADARILQNGRLAPIKSASYRLTLPLDEHAKQGGRWLACGNSFFNFVLKQWQPESRLVAYLPMRHVLYCVFAPAEDALFLKLGYRALGNKRKEAVVQYVEKKTKKLRITNVLGAGLFLMPLPESHTCFDAPEKAAEESLKSAIRTSRHLRANPSGSRGEFVAFSSSLEYYFVKAKPGKGTTLQALTSTLQDFTGDPNLKPFRSVMTPGQVRAGRTKLIEWRGPLETPNVSQRLALPRVSALLSWQKRHKLRGFSRRVSRSLRGRLPFSKRRRKAWSI